MIDTLLTILMAVGIAAFIAFCLLMTFLLCVALIDLLRHP